jgi:3-hydroxy-9,10-secoandrosta-1,3,5(10)-triene-9,17-dione monooxygenase reductase component
MISTDATQLKLKLAENPEGAKDIFRAVAGHWPSGVAVITTTDKTGAPFGLTMSAVTALSLVPVQFLICVDDNSNTLPALLESKAFCINFMAHGQESVAMRFASKKGMKFEGLGFQTLESGSLLIDGVAAYAECRVAAVYDGGDHRIVVGSVIDMALLGGDPLTYFGGQFRRLA